MMFTLIGRFGGEVGGAAFALGIVVFSMSFSIINGLTQSYSYELAFGTLPFLYSSNASRLKNFLARGVLHYPNALIAFALGLTTSYFIAGLGFAYVNWGPFILAVLLIGFSLVSLGQFLGLISIIMRDWISVQSIALAVLVAFCGAIIPTYVFPNVVVTITHAMPITNGLIAVRGAFNGAEFSAVGANIMHEFIVGLVYCAVSFIVFRIIEVYVKRSGKLDREIH